MQRIKMPEILVVSRKKLFLDDYFEGFRKARDINFGDEYEKRIQRNYVFKEREKIEKNPDYKQPIPYVIIFNPKIKKVFSFQRAKKDKDYGEKRLQGKWSFGIGGHRERKDAVPPHPIRRAMLREAEEEVGEVNWQRYRNFGYINDDSDDVGKVHFGIVYLMETHNKIIRPKDREIFQGKLRGIRELEKIIETKDVEEWSKIAFKPLKEYLKC